MLARELFKTLADWDAFYSLALSHNDPRLHRWSRDADRHLRAELSTPSLPDHWGVGAVEQAQQTLRAFIGSRSFCLRNKERTNRMLELIGQHINRTDDVQRYAAAIRAHVQASRGQLARQLSIADDVGPFQPPMKHNEKGERCPAADTVSVCVGY